MRNSKPLLFPTDFPPIRRRRLETLQVSLGYVCNQSCLHCHVAAGPTRTEVMSAETVDAVLQVLERVRPAVLDLTGGAPELNPRFRRLVREAHALGMRVIDRCNLTILEEPGQEGLAKFLADHEVEIIASLPCYLEENVDGQRGKGVFQASLRALTRLNRLGYGDGASGRRLNLVYNPTGPSLPPPQCVLEQDYKRVLRKRYGVGFDRLLTLANMPINRFGSVLQSQGKFPDYIALLKSAHRRENLDAVMCQSLISVDWRGLLYDCDFNQMLGMPLQAGGEPMHVSRLLGNVLQGWPIRVGEHCYGCTAGQGSSCGGALATDES
jgi:radical SAM/Cys-rich protein